MITSSFNTVELPRNFGILTLTPQYMTKQVNKLGKERYMSMYIALFQKTGFQFHTAYMSLNQKGYKANINLNKNNFDYLLIRTMTQKYVERIFIMLSLIYPRIRETILLIEKNNDLPILL